MKTLHSFTVRVTDQNSRTLAAMMATVEGQPIAMVSIAESLLSFALVDQAKNLHSFVVVAASKVTCSSIGRDS